MGDVIDSLRSFLLECPCGARMVGTTTPSVAAMYRATFANRHRQHNTDEAIRNASIKNERLL